MQVHASKELCTTFNCNCKSGKELLLPTINLLLIVVLPINLLLIVVLFGLVTPIPTLPPSVCNAKL
jgi:hypothetical protein